jgi:hypothetical protein
MVVVNKDGRDQFGSKRASMICIIMRGKTLTVSLASWDLGHFSSASIVCLMTRLDTGSETYTWNCAAHPGCSRPALFSTCSHPIVHHFIRKEIGALDVGKHARLCLPEDAQHHGVVKQPSDHWRGQTSFLGNFLIRYFAIFGNQPAGLIQTYPKIEYRPQYIHLVQITSQVSTLYCVYIVLYAAFSASFANLDYFTIYHPDI